MGIAYRCDPNLRCTFAVWDGDVTPEEWSDQLERIVADPAFPPGPLVLADLSTAGGAPSITTDVIDEMARRWVIHVKGLGAMQWAIIPDGAWSKARRFECDVEGRTFAQWSSTKRGRRVPGSDSTQKPYAPSSAPSERHSAPSNVGPPAVRHSPCLVA
jgi:hypothetical protein